MGASETAFVGRFSFLLVPFYRWLLERFRDPAVRKIVCMKSAQVGWTQSVVCNLLGYIADVEQTTCVTMFPKEGSARNFDREKFEPMVESTPRLARIMPTKSRVKDQTALFKSYPGGFTKFVGSNSIADVKSTSARRLMVEEPDDCNLNLRGQGDSIKLLEERGKSFRDAKMVIGGTPSIKGVSSIADEYENSDRCEWHVPCPDCGHFQALEWERVTWLEDPASHHALFGHARPESARYVCVNDGCGSTWNNSQKNAAIQKGRAIANAPFRGVVGLALNELYSSLHVSRLESLVERFLAAKKEFGDGKPEALITFWNAALGRPWEFKGDAPEADELSDRGLVYAPQTVPAGGLVLTMGVDVQHDRVAIVLRAWGRGCESWLVLFEELEGNPLDEGDKVWTDLDAFVFGVYRHASGAAVRLRAVSIDSGDGQTSSQVYSYVRTRRGRGVALMAIKGMSGGREIYTRAAPVDVNRANTKAAKKGLQLYVVGTDRAKDLIDARLRLEGSGPGRFHFYQGVRADYFEQLLSEVKVPHREKRGVKVWQPKRGVRNEALDCEVYALHAAHSLKLHLLREETWAVLELRVKQANLPGLGDAVETEADQAETASDNALEAPAIPNKAPEAPTSANKRVPPAAGNFATNF